MMSNGEDDILFLPDLHVYERDSQPTGLLDQFGRPLVRMKQPIGFDLNPPKAKVKRKLRIK